MYEISTVFKTFLLNTVHGWISVYQGVFGIMSGNSYYLNFAPGSWNNVPNTLYTTNATMKQHVNPHIFTSWMNVRQSICSFPQQGWFKQISMFVYLHKT